MHIDYLWIDELKQNLNLNWLRTFEVVARHTSFTAASKELGLTQAAVSLQIKALETKLGNDLFVRRPKSLQLTEIGKAYLSSIKSSIEALTFSTNGLFGPNLKTTIVVSGSLAIILWLAPKLGDFQKLYPEIGLKLVTAMWANSVETENVDVEIVLAPSNRANSQLTKLSDEFIVPVCGVNTAKKMNSVADLANTSPIHILGFDDHWSRYMSAFGLRHDVASTRLMVDTSVSAFELAAADLGSSVVIERFAQNAIRAGQRIKIVGDRVPLEHAHFLSRKEVRIEIRASKLSFEEWLRDQFLLKI